MKLLSSRTFLITGGLLRSIQGQSSAFTRQKECPNDSSLVGYTNLPDLNDDMAAELQRVSKGGTPPDGGYNLVLCPGENFDTSGGNAIRPVINQVRIACGGPASVDPVCLITGNQEQLVIENPSISRYALKSVTIEGLMFSNFTKRASAALTASSPTMFTCIACSWQDFNGSDFAINLQGTMTARLENSVVRVSEMIENALNISSNHSLIEFLRRGTHREPLGTLLVQLSTKQFSISAREFCKSKDF
jgi:hypothetical protein